MKYLKIFAPATVANVSCGFDSLGLAIDNLGDQMSFEKSDEKGIRIKKITGASLPTDINKNAAGVVANAMLQQVSPNFGIDIEIHKGYKPGSGLGSSAASAAGAAFGVNQLLGNPFSLLELTQFAMLGEEATCGSPIADNVSAALYGGFVLVRNYDPLDIVKIPVPIELRLVCIHPEVTVKTKDARDVLPKEIPLKNAVKQWANVGGLISGLYSNDYELIGNSLVDIIVEPVRKHLIPHFDLVKSTAIKAGALGAGISGSGPSIFALCKGDANMNKVYDAVKNAYKTTSINFSIITSEVNTQGIKILEQY
ncbi:serine kinase [Tenacibaculum holothuriorum]|uniref:Homoserine kinase n=1 Tax=Tenacibaculum holothuriorum TaxID=1635173 RepID=A0A1Y2PES3_9FLAO|nr:homoserine kinase [Tenacibaculum holothuriorum]OSY88168.1 serine kinase [Tenacibaculum holothuriorum]